ncbi:hypothetical protein [Neglectibacter sp. CSJ-5]|uniref:hypothetical protein n=1 Tax=Neglectibacter sp. CSJ-5 TaxID=3078043 RepID=UPI00292D432F|nr:hypothetical protein [Neglectibacter sp. CSJ-5]
MFKKTVSALLAFVMFTVANVSTVQGAEVSRESAEEILSRYHQEIAEVEQGQISVVAAHGSNNLESNGNRIREIQENTVAELKASGYDAYNVNPETFEAMQEVLQTNFEDIGLDASCSYIVIVDGNDANNANGEVTPYGAGSSFNYTSGGTTYKMRYFTITAADDSGYGKASTVNLLRSASKELIQRCLDMAIIAYISAFSKTLGTVASLSGLSVSNFGTSQSSTMDLYGGTNWTRVYTQVWSDYDEAWESCSSVEYAKATSHISGQYYSASANSYVGIPYKPVSTTLYSSKYSDYEWRKSQAVNGYMHSVINYDTTGPVRYRYGSEVKITHTLNR